MSHINVCFSTTLLPPGPLVSLVERRMLWKPFCIRKMGQEKTDTEGRRLARMPDQGDDMASVAWSTLCSQEVKGGKLH